MSRPRKLKIATIATMTTLCLLHPSPEGVARNETSHPDLASTQHITELPPETRPSIVGNRHVERPSRQHIHLPTT